MIKKQYIVAILMLPFVLFAQKATRESYVVKHYKLAIREMNLYKIPASITLAQGIIETNNGTSRLAVEGNNHFGIKCQKVWTGPTMTHDDDAKGECFRVYTSSEESYRDHSLFLTSRDRYKRLFSYDIKDYKSWAYGLKEAGYATNPNYPQMLIKHIEELKLYEYDFFGTSNSEIDTTNKKNLITPNSTLDSGQNIIESGKNLVEGSLKVALDSIVTTFLPFVIVNDNFSIEKVAAEKGFTRRELMIFNECEGEQNLTKGQNFFLQRKEIKSHIAVHEAKLGESIYDISQIYGIKQESIRRFNKLENWEQPQVGEAVFLNSVRNTYMKTRTYYELQSEREKMQKEKIENELKNTIKPQKIYIHSSKDSSVMNDSPKMVIHIVKAKETIFSLAKKYGCKPAEINKWNNLDDAPLQLGQKLTIKLNE